jgi:hypothetical protein
MELLADPSAWDYSTVVEAVRRYHWEPALLDFKEVLHAQHGTELSKQRHNEHVRQTAVAFANGGGGHLLFGVKDPTTTRASAPTDAIVGISLAGDLRKQFGDKLAGVLPPIDFDAAGVSLIGQPAAGQGVLVV